MVFIDQLQKTGFFIALFFLALIAHAQVEPTPASLRESDWQKQRIARINSTFRHYPFQNVGPTVMGGRVVDLAVNPQKTEEYLAAFASGGLWHTKDNGLEFEPIFEQELSLTIGDIVVNWSERIIWVGSGENNSSRSSYAGSGLYKSKDEGKTWIHCGLTDAQHIGRIVLHPTQPQTLWVAVIGHLYSKNTERGVFKSTDGGQTWQKNLFINDSTGVIDLIIDPQNPNILYAAAWERDRKANNFKGQGAGSGIYKTIDGGQTWTRLGGGFPQNDLVGRIGLAISAKTPNLLFAIVDNQNKRPISDTQNKEQSTVKAFRNSLKTMSDTELIQAKPEMLKSFLELYELPEKYTLEFVQQGIKNKSLKAKNLFDLTNDANTALFDTEIIGPELYRSQDGGQSWQKTHQDYIDDMFYTYGYYFGQVCVSPEDDQKIYLLGVPLLKSDDGGKNWQSITKENVHLDMHALWVNPNNPRHLLLGNDGGLNASYNEGLSWSKLNQLPVGQFYSICVDNDKPYNIYGGLQDNGVWYGSHLYKNDRDWQASGRYPYQNLMGGDGMQVQVDPRHSETVYAGFQFGNYARINRHTLASKGITPQNNLNEPPLRYNWQTPIHLSVHQPDVIYIGSQYVHRSMNQGDKWIKLSHDLTQGKKDGNVPFGTLTALHESPLKFGLLYAGADDGSLHGTRDGGATWAALHTDLPQGLWVSSVQASRHQEGRVWLSLNGYRNDHFTAYVFRSDDYGKTWQKLGLNLPLEPVNVVLEDPLHSQICYVGTDNGLYVSLDSGYNFHAMSYLPRVAVHDLVIQEAENHLLVGTHGRSIYRCSLTTLHEFAKQKSEQKFFICQPNNLKYNKNWGQSWSRWFKEEAVALLMSGFIPTAGTVLFEVLSENKEVLFKESKNLEGGFFEWSYGLKTSKKLESFLKKGQYTLRFSVNTAVYEYPWRIE
ncbi:MAG: glycosyl hydrolase [Cytophagales bacterium]|nr:MAG: glycosyl hydrolase [Cytophagales bacterium]TAF61914.1 MAG: glycosyl hydrolase [Cytophagales bacterium]